MQHHFYFQLLESAAELCMIFWAESHNCSLVTDPYGRVYICVPRSLFNLFLLEFGWAVMLET